MDESSETEGLNRTKSFLVLKAAAKDNNSSLVEWLFEQKAAVSEDAIKWAARNGNLSMLQLLIDPRAEDSYSNNFSARLIREASHDGHLDIIQWIDEMFDVKIISLCNGFTINT